jgi:PGF-CTERM protein
MATTNGMVSNLANTSVTFTLIEVIVENNTQDDSDADGVVDSSDACPGYDDTVDADTDGIPDGCDSLIDSDSDGVSDTNDVCLGHNDSIDIDQDGIADGCDSLIDSDADGVSDADDQCAGYNDLLDQDGDGIPDNCDQTPMPEDGQTNVADTNPVDDGETTGIPGFGLLLSITAALGAALIATRRE